MISAVECREHAVECRQMSERAPSLRVRDILIDMARTWERLALETDHSAPTSPKIVLRHQFRREFKARAPWLMLADDWQQVSCLTIRKRLD